MKRGRLTDSGHLRRAEVPHSISVIKDKLFHIQKQLFKKQKAKLVFLVRFFGQGRERGSPFTQHSAPLMIAQTCTHAVQATAFSEIHPTTGTDLHFTEIKIKKKKREFLPHHPLSEESDSVSSRPPREPFSLEFVFYLMVQFRDQLLSD